MNDAPQVNILLSAYNGEKYLPAQLASLRAQSWGNTVLCLRDDGSSDGTKDILRAWEKDPGVRVSYGENMGFIRSFLTLLAENGDGEYYAFCDQDDVWQPEKLQRAVEALSALPADRPALWFCSYDLYDENMRFSAHHAPVRNVGFRNSLADCAPLGFCTVLNRAARDEIAAHIPQAACGHDWWAYMVCAGLGEVVSDETPLACYRRHGENVSAGGMGFLRFQLWRFKKFFRGGYFENITAQLREYETLYASRLAPEQRALLALFTEKTLPHQLRKAFAREPWRQKASDEVLLRLCFLLGKL